MNSQYNEDQNQPLVNIQTQSNGGLMNYIKNHKMATLVVVILIVLLIWWFCFRKKNDVGYVSVNSASAPNFNGSKIRVTSTRTAPVALY